MSLRPAAEFVLVHGGNAVTLRASLRAAVNIDSLDGGFPAVLDRLAGQSYTATCAVIRASATDRHQAERFIAAAGCTILQGFLPQAQAACLSLIAALLPAPDGKAKPSSTTSPETAGKPWSDHFGDLFGYGTGWLGWTPEATWSASPAELTAAFEAHAERLIAMNGGREGDEDDAPAKPKAKRLTEEQRQANAAAGLDPEFDREGLRSLKAKLGR